jgi:gliding motility associated protien GldN
MTKYALFILIITSFQLVKSQGNVGPSNVIVPPGQPGSGVIDGVYEKKDVLAKKRAIPYEFVRENDYVWGKRTWSYIDLREKINHPLYYPNEKIDDKSPLFAQGRYSLFYILTIALKNGQLMGYYNDKPKSLFNAVERLGGDDFSIPLKRNYQVPYNQDQQFLDDLDEMISVAEVDLTKYNEKSWVDNNGIQQPVYHKKGVTNFDVKQYLAGKGMEDKIDANTETTNESDAETTLNPVTNVQEGRKVLFAIKTITPYQPKDIIKYLLKEDWFFDKERSILDVRTIGLAPVFKADTSSQEKILFWVYFPQARDILKNYYVYDAKSTVGGNTFDHLFMTRRFNAVVYKESTLYDRKIEDYRFGADALYESEKVKNTIRTFEHDVWNF